MEWQTRSGRAPQEEISVLIAVIVLGVGIEGHNMREQILSVNNVKTNIRGLIRNYFRRRQ